MLVRAMRRQAMPKNSEINLRQFTNFSKELNRELAIIHSPPEVKIDIVHVLCDRVEFNVTTTRKGKGSYLNIFISPFYILLCLSYCI
jgi:hypothetical protein